LQTISVPKIPFTSTFFYHFLERASKFLTNFLTQFCLIYFVAAKEKKVFDDWRGSFNLRKVIVLPLVGIVTLSVIESLKELKELENEIYKS